MKGLPEVMRTERYAQVVPENVADNAYLLGRTCCVWDAFALSSPIDRRERHFLFAGVIA
jgi:hypothetical protein